MQAQPQFAAVVLNKVDFARNKYYYSRYYGHQYKNYYAEAALLMVRPRLRPPPVIGWALVAFAGAYRWTTVPLFAGVAALLARRTRRRSAADRPVARLRCSCCASSSSPRQLVPLPSAVHDRAHAERHDRRRAPSRFARRRLRRRAPIVDRS